MTGGKIFCEWQSDVQRGPNGKIVFAGIADSTRQNIERLLLTTPAETLPDGTKTVADYVWRPDFGLGFRAYLGQLHKDQLEQALKTKCIQSLRGNPNIQQAPSPLVDFTFKNPFLLQVYVDYILTNGIPQTAGVEIQQ